jgi:DNA-binding beta-propeller fold protein YncE
VWDDERVVGVCLPEINRVAIGRVLGSAIRFPSNREIGDGYTGSLPGQFVYPMSVDAGPDGRVYVLDAGNSRIQVFDDRSRYITEWGEPGDGDGQFDFGDGGNFRPSVPNLYGSLAVDDDGFIYVADVGNRRIQKFAP